MNKETLHFNSGLYEQDTFYIIHTVKNDKEREKMINKCNKKLLVKAWGIEDLKEVEKNLRYHLNFYNLYKPKIIDEKLAIECRLTPIYRPFLSDYDYVCLLMGSHFDNDFDLFSSLDAYQLLTHGTIDSKSFYYSDKKRFEKGVGKEIMAKVNAILNREK